MQCDKLRDDRLDVLYGEADSDARRRVEEHVATCPACADEMAGLQGLRQELKAWTIPERREPLYVAPRRRQNLWLPMAAGLLLALGAGFLLARIDVRYDAGRVAVSFGRPLPVDDARTILAEHEAR